MLGQLSCWGNYLSGICFAHLSVVILFQFSLVWLKSVEKLIIGAIKPINNIGNILIAFKINYRKKSVF